MGNLAVSTVVAFVIVLAASSPADGRGMDQSTTAILAIVSGLLSATGLVSQLIGWLRSRSEKRAEIEAAKLKKLAELDAKEIEAELTINDRLLTRVASLEAQLAAERADHTKAQRTSEHDRAALMVEMSKLQRELDRRKTNEENLIAANKSQAIEIARKEADEGAILEHVKRLEFEVKRLKSELGDEPTRATRVEEVAQRTKHERR